MKDTERGDFEWDEQKDSSNISKHGISFKEACLIFEAPVLTRPDTRYGYGEDRELSLGVLGTQVILLVVHTNRKGSIRLISARIANRKEREIYYEYIQKKT